MAIKIAVTEPEFQKAKGVFSAALERGVPMCAGPG